MHFEWIENALNFSFLNMPSHDKSLSNTFAVKFRTVYKAQILPINDPLLTFGKLSDWPFWKIWHKIEGKRITWLGFIRFSSLGKKLFSWFELVYSKYMRLIFKSSRKLPIFESCQNLIHFCKSELICVKP